MRAQAVNNGMYKSTETANIRRSVHNLSFDKKFTADMGQLIPIACEEAIPGDIWKIGTSAIVRFQPMVAPILHAVYVATYWFYVKNTLLMDPDDYESFFTRGPTGNTVQALPEWETSGATTEALSTLYADKLWDYMGLPVETSVTYDQIASSRPLAFPKYAYNLVYNEFFRNPDLQSAVSLEQEEILNRNWMKDYFTAARPWPQRGDAPTIPVSGSVDFDFPEPGTDQSGNNFIILGTQEGGSGTLSTSRGTASSLYSGQSTGNNATNMPLINAMYSDYNSLVSSGFDVNDLRYSMQVQRWMELQAKGGSRYNETIWTQYRVKTKDGRIQRPEFIGGSWKDLIVSEVLQTSEDGTTPQGNMAGHAISYQSENIGKFRVDEPGWILGLACVIPNANYQNGIDRQFLKKTTFEYPFPVFEGLGDQEIYNAEICIQDTDAEQLQVFGYQGRFDDMRYRQNKSVSGMRSTFSYWHLGRIFDPTSPPALNDAFLQCSPRKDIFAVSSDPGMICDFGNHLIVNRQIMREAVPFHLGV